MSKYFFSTHIVARSFINSTWLWHATSQARTRGWSSIIIIALPATLESLPDHLEEGLKVCCVDAELCSAVLSSCTTTNYSTAARDNRPHWCTLKGPLRLTGWPSSIMLLFHLSFPPSFLPSSPPCIDGFFSLDVCRLGNLFTSFHPAQVKSIAECFFAKLIISWKV